MPKLERVRPVCFWTREDIATYGDSLAFVLFVAKLTLDILDHPRYIWSRARLAVESQAGLELRDSGLGLSTFQIVQLR